jgi:hypothetical protein
MLVKEKELAQLEQINAMQLERHEIENRTKSLKSSSVSSVSQKITTNSAIQKSTESSAPSRYKDADLRR